MTRNRQKNSNKLKSGMAIAALGTLALAVCPAEAQFGNIVNPLAPRVFSLGGPINQFGLTGNNGAVASFGGFSPIVGNANNFNSFNNVPLSNFRQPRMIVDPSVGFANQFGTFGTSALPIDTTMFFANNPGISPFNVNGSLNGNFGINTFNNNSVGFNTLSSLNTANTLNNLNTLNSLNTVNTFNSNGFVNSSVLLNNQLNAQANTQQPHIFRPAPAYNPSIPNPPASRYQQTTDGSNAAAMQTGTAFTNPSGLPSYYWNWTPPPTPPAGRLWIVGNGANGQSQAQAQTFTNPSGLPSYYWNWTPPPTPPAGRLWIVGNGMMANGAGATNGMANYGYYPKPAAGMLPGTGTTVRRWFLPATGGSSPVIGGGTMVMGGRGGK